MRLRAEVVVVGAGPAGSTLAARLASVGRRVLLLDRASFPRAKACGECVNPGAVRMLQDAGLLDAPEALGGCPMRGWILATPEGHRVRADFPRGRRALGIDRRRLDAALLEEARARGVEVREGFRVTGVEAGDARLLARARGTGPDGTPFRVEGSILVGADGLRSVVAREIGVLRDPAGRRKASLTWRLAGDGPSRKHGRLLLGENLTVGLAPVPPAPGSAEGLWNATVVVALPEHRASLKETGERRLREGMRALAAGWRDGYRIVDGPWASGPFDWPAGPPARNRVLVVGDAAGYYDPLTGQGIYRALRGAELAAVAIDRALPPPEAWRGTGARTGRAEATAPVDARELAGYARDLPRAFRTGRRVQRVIEAVVTRPRLRGPVFAALARSPRLAGQLVRVVGDVPRRGGARYPGA